VDMAAVTRRKDTDCSCFDYSGNSRFASAAALLGLLQEGTCLPPPAA
jgi:hypothetical protein